MNTRFPLSVALIILSFSCSPPQQPEHTPDPEMELKWADDNLREIHDLKNNRQTEGLISFLRDASPRYRAEAAMALGSVQDTTAVEALTTILRDQSPEVRMIGAFALGQMKNRKAAIALIELVERDTTTAVRTEALEAIGKTGQPEAAEFLANYLPNYFFDESGHAWGIYQLALKGGVGEMHMQIMTALLASEYEETRLAAAHYFMRIDAPESTHDLERLLNLASKDPSPEVRIAATAALGKIDLRDREEILKALLVYDQHPGVRVEAVRALTKMKSGAEAIEEALFDGNPNVSLAAAQFFAEHPEFAGNSRLRQQAVAHQVSSVRGALYAALLQYGQNQQEILGEMKRAMQEQPESAVLPLIEALRYAPESEAMLDSLCFGNEVVFRVAAMQSLMYQYKDADCQQWQSFFERIFAQGDYGQLALLGNRLGDKDFEGRKCWDDAISFPEIMENIVLPEGLEAWIELNRAHASITRSALLPVPELPYHSIDWNRLKTAGSQPTVSVQTNKGSFSMVLLSEDAPATVSSFLEQMDAGFFNGKPFHRVVPDFVVQTGCPRGDGYGSGSELLRSEFPPLHYGPGVVGMASAGKDTESTQWFVTHRTTPHLDGRYTIFAAVIEGMDVVWQLQEGGVIESVDVVSGL